MNRYLVISYDSDEQQAMYDWVLADDEDQAREWVEGLRYYADVVDVLTLDDLFDITRRFALASDADIRRSMNEVKSYHDHEEETG